MQESLGSQVTKETPGQQNCHSQTVSLVKVNSWEVPWMNFEKIVVSLLWFFPRKFLISWEWIYWLYFKVILTNHTFFYFPFQCSLQSLSYIYFFWRRWCLYHTWQWSGLTICSHWGEIPNKLQENYIMGCWEWNLDWLCASDLFTHLDGSN